MTQEPEIIEVNGQNPTGEQEPANNQRNGYASQAYPFLEREVGGNNFVAARELFHGSNKPTEYLPRTRIDESEIGRSMRIVARHNRVTKGYSDRPSITAWKYNARMGLGGKARREVVSVATSVPYDPRQQQGRMGGIMDRARDVHPQGGKQAA